MISARRAYIVLDNPRPPKGKKEREQRDMACVKERKTEARNIGGGFNLKGIE